MQKCVEAMHLNSPISISAEPSHGSMQLFNHVVFLLHIRVKCRLSRLPAQELL